MICSLIILDQLINLKKKLSSKNTKQSIITMNCGDKVSNIRGYNT